MAKRTVIKPDEELLVQGKLTVTGDFTQVQETTVVTNLEAETFTINSDGTNLTSKLVLNSNGDTAELSFLDSADTLSSSKSITSSLGFIGDVTGTVSSIANHSTTDLSEGTNLYWTTARGNSMFDTRLATKDTDDLAEGSTNLYYTDARARAAISRVDAGGDGSLAYNNSTGVITYTGPSAAEVRAHFSATDAGGDGSFSYSAGVFTYTGPSPAEVRAHLSVSGDLAYNSSTGVISFTERTDAEVRGLVSHVDAGGDGSFAYNNSTGVFTYTGPSASEVRAHSSGGDGINYASGVIDVDTTVVRTSGTQSIGGAKTFTSGVTLPSQTSILPSASGGDYVAGTGDDELAATTEYVEAAITSLIDGAPGTLNTINEIAAALNDDDGIGADVIDHGTRITTLEGRDLIAGTGLTGGGTDLLSDVTFNVVGGNGITVNANDIITDDTYIKGLISVTDSGGDGSLAYNSTSGVITYTGPSAAEVRAHSSGGDGINYASGVIDVDATVVRTTGDQSLAGEKSFTGDLLLPTSSSTTNNALFISGGIVYARIGGSDVQLTADSDIGEVEDVGATGTNIYAGFRQVTVGNATVNYHGIKSISDGDYTTASEAANVITIDGDISAIRGAFSATGLVSYNNGTGAFTTTADLYDSWKFTTATAGNVDISSDELLTFTGGSGITVSHSGSEITITNTDVGDISSVVAGAGLTGGATSGDATLDIGAGTGITVNANDIAINFKDEDNMASDSATHAATQQSIKAYVDAQVDTADHLSELGGDTDDVGEGSTNLYFTDARSRAAVSVTDSGGDGSLAYNNSTGVITYTGPSAVEVRSHSSGGDGIDYASGVIDVDATVIRTTGDQSLAGTKTFSGTAIVSATPSAGTHITNKTYVDTEITSATSATNVVRTTGTQASIAGAKTFTNVLTGSAGVSDGTATMSSGALTGVTSITATGNVSGNYFVGTATQAQYADLAENYSADAPYEPGTVLVLGGDAEVTQSTKENSPAIAGVVSTKPAHLMNVELEGDNVVAVALRGRIPCKVYGPVRVGDTLIASSTPGHAKAAPFRGYQTPAVCIIGKAITQHSSMAAGEIEILV